MERRSLRYAVSAIRLLTSYLILLAAAVLAMPLFDTPSTWLLPVPPWVIALVASGLLMTFCLRARGRRVLLLLVLATLVAMAWTAGPAINWIPLLWIGAIAAVTLIVTESVRQNIAFIRGLRGQKIFTALALWSPMLMLAGLGLLAGQYLQDAAEQLVYDQTPVDQYCQGVTLPIPCEGLQLDSMEPKPMDLAYVLSYHVSARFRDRQREFISRLNDTSADGAVDARRFRSAQSLKELLAELDRDLQTASVLSLPSGSRLTAAELLAGDVSLQRLIRRRDAERATQRANEGRGLGRLIKRIKAQLAADELDKQIAARKQDLLSHRRRDLIKPEELAASVREQLARRLPKSPPSAFDASLVVTRADQADGVSAQLTALAVARLADLEPKALQQARQIAIDIEPLHKANPGKVRAPEDQFAALGFSPVCSNLRKSSDIHVTDDERSPKVDVNKAPFLCSEIAAAGPGTIKPLNLEASLSESISQWRRDAETGIERKTQVALVTVIRASERGARMANAMVEQVPATIDLGRKPCRWWPPHTWVNCLVNKAKASAEEAYADERARSVSAYKEAVSRTKSPTQRNAAQQILDARERALKQLDEAASNLDAAVKRISEWVRVLNWLLTLLLVLALIKSFLYVLSLLVFDLKGAARAQVATSPRVVGAAPRIATPGEELRFTDTTKDKPLVTLAQLDNQLPRIRVAPWPFSGVLPRILRLKYWFFNAGGPVFPDRAVTWQCPAGKNIVDWPLSEGEEVVFRFADFFGASDNIVLRRRLSFRVDTMLLGRFTFHSACAKGGPGHLLLLTQAISKGSVERDDLEAAEPERFLAWHVHSSFMVANELTLRSIFLDPFALVRARDESPRGRVLVESSQGGVRPLAGLLRYVWRVLSPI